MGPAGVIRVAPAFSPAGDPSRWLPLRPAADPKKKFGETRPVRPGDSPFVGAAVSFG
jgi:hypothetical protein